MAEKFQCEVRRRDTNDNLIKLVLISRGKEAECVIEGREFIEQLRIHFEVDDARRLPTVLTLELTGR